MLPKWHIIIGLIFSFILLFFFKITFFEAFIVFLASVLIDIDHYFWYVINKKSFNIKNAYQYITETQIKKSLILFHTLEFLSLILILAFIFKIFLFILIGFLFHSILDIIQLLYKNKLQYREFSLINSIRKNKWSKK